MASKKQVYPETLLICKDGSWINVISIQDLVEYEGQILAQYKLDKRYKVEVPETKLVEVK